MTMPNSSPRIGSIILADGTQVRVRAWVKMGQSGDVTYWLPVLYPGDVNALTLQDISSQIHAVNRDGKTRLASEEETRRMGVSAQEIEKAGLMSSIEAEAIGRGINPSSSRLLSNALASSVNRSFESRQIFGDPVRTMMMINRYVPNDRMLGLDNGSALQNGKESPLRQLQGEIAGYIQSLGEGETPNADYLNAFTKRLVPELSLVNRDAAIQLYRTLPAEDRSDLPQDMFAYYVSPEAQAFQAGKVQIFNPETQQTAYANTDDLQKFKEGGWQPVGQEVNAQSVKQEMERAGAEGRYQAALGKKTADLSNLTAQLQNDVTPMDYQDVVNWANRQGFTKDELPEEAPPELLTQNIFKTPITDQIHFAYDTYWGTRDQRARIYQTRNTQMIAEGKRRKEMWDKLASRVKEEKRLAAEAAAKKAADDAAEAARKAAAEAERKILEAQAQRDQTYRPTRVVRV